MPAPTRSGVPTDRSTIIGAGVETLSRWSLRLVLLAAGGYVLWYALGAAWVVVLPVSLAIVLSTLLLPVVDFVARRGIPRTLASVVTVLTLLVAFAGILALMTASVVGQVGDVADEASDGLLRVQDWVTGPPLNLSEDQIDEYVGAVTDRLEGAATQIAGGVFTGVTTATNLLVNIVLVLILTFLCVKDGHRFLPWLRATGGDRVGHHAGEVLSRCYATIGSFIRTQLVVSAVDAVFIGIGLLLLGVPLALTLAVLTFFAGFIPIAGALAAGAVSVLVALVTAGPGTALAVVVLIVVVQQVEGNVLSPILQGRSLRLHAGVVLMSVTAGGSLFGITGAFLAVPVVATVATVLRYLGECIDATIADRVPGPGDGVLLTGSGTPDVPAPERTDVPARAETSADDKRPAQPRDDG